MENDKSIGFRSGRACARRRTQDKAPDGPILFTNVDVFDGMNMSLMKDVNVVVTDNIITAVSTEDLAVAG